MNMLIASLRLLAIVLAAHFLAPCARAEHGASRAYEPTFESLVRISRDLHQALDDKRRRLVGADPQVSPAVKGFCLAAVNGVAGAPNAIAFSPTFVACLNQLAHARALDNVASGYFAEYVLSQPADGAVPWESVGKSLPAETVWSFDVMNHQVSLFNQMAGTLIAVQMAHHYLGHTKRVPASVGEGAVPSPIVDRLTEKEWRDAVLKGAKNALDCGLGVEGFRALLSVAGTPSSRPRWSACFIHSKADTVRLSRDLEKLEKDFFLVGQ